MHLKKTVVLIFVSTILLLCSFSGCVFDNILGITNFTLNSSSVCDDNGFPGISFSFSCSGTVNIKLLSPSSDLLDSDFFFVGDHDAIFHLAEYRHSVNPGTYKLKVYDKNNKEIRSETFSFSGANLSIISCDQKWWKRDSWIGGYSLFGLGLRVQNNGDVPAYPDSLDVTMDSKTISGLALPTVILPQEMKDVNSFIYRDKSPTNSKFSINLKDTDGNLLADGIFSINVQDNVPIQKFSWSYGSGRRTVNIPKSEYLYDYYISLPRTKIEDYSLYVFDQYDDQYVDIVKDLVMFGFGTSSDVERINFAASFVQSIAYKPDSPTNSSYEYPRYPIETLFNGNGGGGDCEDKAILLDSILKDMGYDVALFRFPNHMACGVNLSKTENPGYEYYANNYFYLESTTEGKPVGSIPDDYVGLSSEVTVYPLSSRPLLYQEWQNGSIIIYSGTERGDFVKVSVIIQNLGTETARNFVVEAGFYMSDGVRLNYDTSTVFSLGPFMKKRITFSVNIPKDHLTWFKTKIYLDGIVVNEEESASSFP